MVKDEAEIALLARACAITDEAFAAALPASGRAGPSASSRSCWSGR